MGLNCVYCDTCCVYVALKTKYNRKGDLLTAVVTSKKKQIFEGSASHIYIKYFVLTDPVVVGT